MRTTILAVLVVSFAAVAQTEARAAIEKKYPGATVSALEREGDDFEAHVTTGGRTLDVKVTAAGRIVEEEEKVSAKELPEAVTKALAATPQAKWRVVSIEKVVRDEKVGEPLFEIELENGKKKVELVFDAKGTLKH